MKHVPNAAEQATIDELLERLRFEFVPVRLTSTMLGKSIIDARGPLRFLFARSGIVDFATIGQGAAHKRTMPLPLVVGQDLESRTFTFYRPETKQGDPRIWIERLARHAKPGDLLLFIFANQQVAALIVRGSVEDLATALSQIAPSRFEERGEIEGLVKTLSSQIHALRHRWIRTMRSGATGVGFTLESLLGIKANTSKKADVGGIELKAYRRGAKSGPGKLVTLFSQTPNHWLGTMSPAALLDRYGYENKVGRRQLYCTITQRVNSLGFSLDLLTDESRADVAKAGEPLMSYTFAKLESRLHEKHPSTLFVRASYRGRGNDEEFCFDEVVYCREPAFANFLDLASEDLVGVDLTLSRRVSGAVRDHGYLWRIREASIPTLFAYRRVLAAPET